MSEEAYQRICKQHSLITLRRKGLDFVISDVDEEEKMASMFDHERILHSFWAAWVRIIWIMRCSISMRYRDIHDNIKKQQVLIMALYLFNARVSETRGLLSIRGKLFACLRV